jgi:hypothetical protein
MVLGAASLLAAQDQVAFFQQAAPGRGVAGVVTGSTVEFVAGQMIGEAVKGAPFSGEAVTETVQVLADGNRIVHRSSSKQYRDSEGRERRENTLPKIGGLAPGSAENQFVFISDPVAGLNFTLDTNKKTAQKMPRPEIKRFPALAGAPEAGIKADVLVGTFAAPVPPPPPAPAPGVFEPPVIVYSSSRTARVGPAGGIAVGAGVPGGPGNTNTEQLGTRNIEGVLAEGTRTTFTIPAGQIGNERPLEIVSERWYSQELKMTVMTRQTDPRTGETTFKLTGINRGEPARYLFEVPADYTITDGPTFDVDLAPAVQKLRKLDSPE